MDLKLKELRVSENLTQKELANKLEITQFTYSNYETGFTEPSIETLVKLADHYHVTLDYLVGREFANDAGYLTADEKEMLKMFRKLDTIKKAKAVAYTAGMLTLE